MSRRTHRPRAGSELRGLAVLLALVPMVAAPVLAQRTDEVVLHNGDRITYWSCNHWDTFGQWSHDYVLIEHNREVRGIWVYDDRLGGDSTGYGNIGAPGLHLVWRGRDGERVTFYPDPDNYSTRLFARGDIHEGDLKEYTCRPHYPEGPIGEMIVRLGEVL